MLASVGAGADVPVTIVLDESSRSAFAALGARWKKPSPRVHILEGGIPELSRLVEATGAETVVIAALTCVCVIDAGALRDSALSAAAHVVKFSVGRTPIEAFAAERGRMLRILEAAAPRRAPGALLRHRLFDSALHGSIDVLEDLPGELLFQNDLMDYYRNNMWLVGTAVGERFHRTAARLPVLNDKGEESRIGEKGAVHGSWIASGVEIEGVVEDSLLFPNVIVRRNAIVSRSVVLGGNRIGAGTEVQGALVCPYLIDAPRSSSNIGENCTLGARSSAAHNADFPAHVRDGLVLVGTNAEIPHGFKAEGGTYIAPGIPPSVLRRLKVLRRGTSVLPGSSGASAAHAAEAAG